MINVKAQDSIDCELWLNAQRFALREIWGERR